MYRSVLCVPSHKKACLWGFKPGLTQTGCTATEDGVRLEIQIQKETGLYYLYYENKGVDQLCAYKAADLRLSFCMPKNHETADVFQ